MDRPEWDRFLEEAGDLILDYLFPNEPVTEEERAAFERARTCQAAYMQEQAGMGRAKALQVGHWRVEQDIRRGSSDICPRARSILLRAGLCYRGLEGRLHRQMPCVPRPCRPPRVPERDKWPGRRTRENPPPRGIPPQGDPPLPGLPEKKEIGDAGDDRHVPRPPA